VFTPQTSMAVPGLQSSQPGSPRKTDSESSLMGYHEQEAVTGDNTNTDPTNIDGSVLERSTGDQHSIALHDLPDSQHRHDDQAQSPTGSATFKDDGMPASLHNSTPVLWNGTSFYSFVFDVFGMVISLCFVGEYLVDEGH
jgi:hypothetical protein